MNLRPAVPTSIPASGRGRLAIRVLAGAVLIIVLSLPVASFALADPAPFADVPADHPYAAAVADLSSRGIIGGYTTGDFGLNDPVKRAQFAKMILGTLGIPPNSETDTHFADLGTPDANGYPHVYVQAAFDRGITRGTAVPNLFAPWDSIRRDQVVSMIIRAINYKAPKALEGPPSGYTGYFGGVGDPHGSNLRLAQYNGVLNGLVGFGAGWAAPCLPLVARWRRCCTTCCRFSAMRPLLPRPGPRPLLR